MEFNDVLLVYFVELIITDAFKNKLPVLAIEAQYWLELVITVDIPAAKGV